MYFSRIQAIFEVGSDGPNLLGLGAKENNQNLKMINISDYVFRDTLQSLLRSVKEEKLMKERRKLAKEREVRMTNKISNEVKLFLRSAFRPHFLIIWIMLPAKKVTFLKFVRGDS